MFRIDIVVLSRFTVINNYVFHHTKSHFSTDEFWILLCVHYRSNWYHPVAKWTPEVRAVIKHVNICLQSFLMDFYKESIIFTEVSIIMQLINYIFISTNLMKQSLVSGLARICLILDAIVNNVIKSFDDNSKCILC